MKYVKLFEGFLNEGKSKLLGKDLPTPFSSEVTMTQANIDCVISFLEQKGIEATDENIALLVANIMPTHKDSVAFDNGKGFDIDDSDFDSWEDVRSNFPGYEDVDESLNEADRSIKDIAADVKADWKNVSPYAKPYLDAMFDLNTIDDKYIEDSASSVLSYFLANAATWKGEKAKAIKKELNDMLKVYYKKNK